MQFVFCLVNNHDLHTVSHCCFMWNSCHLLLVTSRECRMGFYRCHAWTSPCYQVPRNLHRLHTAKRLCKCCLKSVPFFIIRALSFERIHLKYCLLFIQIYSHSGQINISSWHFPRKHFITLCCFRREVKWKLLITQFVLCEGCRKRCTPPFPVFYSRLSCSHK